MTHLFKVTLTKFVHVVVTPYHEFCSDKIFQNTKSLSSCCVVYNGRMRILGIDPGIAIVGYSVIDAVDGVYTLVSSGSIQTDKNKSEAGRLYEIATDLEEIIKAYKPDTAGVEKLYFFKNQKTIIPVAQARGVIMMTLEKYSISAVEYTPIVVKQTITGYGRASKDEVARSVEQMVEKDGKNWPKLDDTVDSIAIAVCHARNEECNLSQYAV